MVQFVRREVLAIGLGNGICPFQQAHLALAARAPAATGAVDGQPGPVSGVEDGRPLRGVCQQVLRQKRDGIFHAVAWGDTRASAVSTALARPAARWAEETATSMLAQLPM